MEQTFWKDEGRDQAAIVYANVVSSELCVGFDGPVPDGSLQVSPPDIQLQVSPPDILNPIPRNVNNPTSQKVNGSTGARSLYQNP